MSDFLHKREYLKAGDVAVLNCDTQCNFMLLTDSQFNNYKSRRKHQYYGGHFKMFPAKIIAPHSDNWNVVIDLGGGKATIRHSLSFIKN